MIQDLIELAGDMSSVAFQDWRVAIGDLSGVVEDDDLGGEVWWIVLGVGCCVATPREVLRNLWWICEL